MTVPRWQVLNEADRIIGEALAGRTEDVELRFLARALRAREMEQRAVAQIRGQFEKFRMSPMAKMLVFYVLVFALSIAATTIQDRISGGDPSRAPRSRGRRSR